MLSAIIPTLTNDQELFKRVEQLKEIKNIEIISLKIKEIITKKRNLSGLIKKMVKVYLSQ